MKRERKSERIDKLLVERGLAESRTKAQAMVMAGVVLVDEQRVVKPSDSTSLQAFKPSVGESLARPVQYHG